MIKAILFDFDGVLTVDKTGSTSITNYLAQQTGLALETIRQSYYSFNKDLLYGHITHEEMWPDFCNAVGQSIDYQLLIDSFVHTPLDEQMIALVRQLKAKYRIGLVTDNKCDRIETVLRCRNLGQWFDAVAVSASLHIGKDYPEIFEHVLCNLRVQAAECVFIDNTAKNLTIPGKMGMQTILYDDEKRDFEAFATKLFEMIHYE